MFITIGLIVLVAALNIVATLIMMVLEKTRDIAILMSMGATKKMCGGFLFFRVSLSESSARSSASSLARRYVISPTSIT